MDSFKFKIVTPERIVFTADVTQATLPTESGEITVLPHHIPLVSIVSAGEVRVITVDGKEEALAVSSGFVQASPKELTILADTAEMAHEIIEEQAAEAHRRARELLEQKTGMPDRDFAALKVLMDKEMARLKIARKYKQKGIRTGDLK